MNGTPTYRAATAEEHWAANALISLAFGRPESTKQAWTARPRRTCGCWSVTGTSCWPRCTSAGSGSGGSAARSLGPGAAAGDVAAEPRRAGPRDGLMTGFLHELHDEGVPTATLFASTAALYRGSGFEAAGDWTEYKIRAEHLPRTTAPWRSAGAPGRPRRGRRAVRPGAAAGRHGALVRDERWWREHIVGTNTEHVVQFVLDGPLPGTDEEGPVGWALVGYVAEEHWKARLWSGTGAACQARAGAVRPARRLRRPRRDGRMDRAGPGPGPARPAGAPVRDRHATWYLRVVDLQLALTSRPYPEALRGTVRMRVNDPRCPWNTGTWLLEVADGRGTAQPISAAPPGRPCGSSRAGSVPCSRGIWTRTTWSAACWPTVQRGS